ncbi:MAG: DUF3800 domain-containing protein [Marinospirillum sp.]|uniref:DUF3800 domain-containing protein n=1 Tax=Marinospirillum sp. TaxID=2183934 RepID=UPI001A0B2AFD|nr:DUF3800 domain-containing protein [Marinospirillum sp.]MBE0508581.1 DUF3800 domain-containing protein [Marinospirillum sp.]
MKEPTTQLPLFDFDPENLDHSRTSAGHAVPVTSSDFSKYIVYVDESGDHSLQSVDSQYPVFVLAFCIFHKEQFKTHVVVEQRGRKEDNELELEFRRICDGNNRLHIAMPFDVIFSDKKVMSTGLQLADLVARPIGLHTIRPEQENKAFEILKHKFYCEGGRDKTGEGYKGMGMKVYPAPESEKPR